MGGQSPCPCAALISGPLRSRVSTLGMGCGLSRLPVAARATSPDLKFPQHPGKKIVNFIMGTWTPGKPFPSCNPVLWDSGLVNGIRPQCLWGETFPPLENFRATPVPRQPILADKRRWNSCAAMSVKGHKRTSVRLSGMSALHPKADIQSPVGGGGPPC